MHPPIKYALCTMAALALAAPCMPTHAQATLATTQVSGGAGTTTAIAHWQIHDSAKAQQGGAEISTDG
jgi:exo-1,4-beta-D-glucosaminidase